ncbi:hypothetical protein [Saccharothrix sp. NRRL B-16314]|uniref:hypothetical protein n=1 Tax=Saccharothrix sp. NRRL B-16314 TaxID=1463825 RepID=UPI0012DFE36F|nr:hypothetical protein [Saccharothrix sp. NRRL B-16314]
MSLWPEGEADDAALPLLQAEFDRRRHAVARTGCRPAQHPDQEVEGPDDGSAEGRDGHDFRREGRGCHVSMVELAFDAGKIPFE